MYKLNTRQGRLLALANNHTLALQTEFNGVVYANIHTLQQHIRWAMDVSVPCQIKCRTRITPQDYNEACDAIGFEGVVRDELRAALFGVLTPFDEEKTEVLPFRSYDLSGKAGRFERIDTKDMVFPHERGKPC